MLFIRLVGQLYAEALSRYSDLDRSESSNNKLGRLDKLKQSHRYPTMN